jgi:hypothetical protein
MSVDGVAADVVDVIARARSLFAAATPAEAVDTDTSAAAEASAAIAGRTDELSGSFADAHRDALDEVSTGLQHASDADARLADHVSDAADTAHAGAAAAEHLHAATIGVADAIEPWAELPAAELAKLKALRQHVAAADVGPHCRSPAVGRWHRSAGLRAVARRSAVRIVEIRCAACR